MGANQSNETLLTIDSDAHGYRYWAKFDREPFSEGASRYAYRGTLSGDGPRNGDKCVVKVFKEKYEKEILNWYIDITCSKVAQELARQFNQFRPTNRPLSFKLPLVAKMDKKSGFNLLWLIKLQDEDKRILENEYVALEPYLEGKYDKFNSNSGWVSDEIGQLMPAFSHFTWWKSGQTMLVCDLQGVKYSDSYELTDPAIHSTDESRFNFGLSDLGQDGIDAFFSTHKCTELCNDIPLPRYKTRSRIRPRRNTTYTFQV